MRKIRSFVFFIIALIFVFAFFIYLSEGKNLSLNKNEILKLSYDVLQAAEKNEEKIKVIVELEDSVIEKGKFGVSSVKNVDKNSFIMQNEKIRKKIKHTFIYSNAFSAELSPSEIEELAKKPEVKKIHYDYPVQAFLQHSVPLINASSSWNLEVDGINLTGGGQTICVIDTGVDYRHSDLGGCTKIFSNTSEEQNIGPLISPGYPNNYPNYGGNCINTHNISANGDGIEVYFEDLDIGDDDYLYLTNEQNEIYAYATNGSEQGAWSPLSITNKIKIFLCTNSSSGRGYNIKKIRVYNFSSSCNKIIWGIDLYNLDFDPLDDNGHGTHVAGIVGANGTIKGVAPGSKILAVKALNSDGGGFSSDIIAGIEYCINKSEELNISVISMSLGANCNEYPQYCHNNYCDEDDSLTAQSINLAVSKNISVVIATGNNGNSTHISESSCVYNATRVGSTTKSDGVSSFSNRWALEMLMAPGSSINSTKINGDYTTMSGTSMATPHVSGAIAIIRQYLAITNRTITPKEIEFLLNKTGKSISADGRTYKRIDLLSALLEIDVTPPKINVSGIENNTKIFERNLTFNYSVSDWQLANV
ncbi:MAG: S8 family serine peptidase, partial [Candidatus Pacearchaeota archaeon]